MRTTKVRQETKCDGVYDTVNIHGVCARFESDVRSSVRVRGRGPRFPGRHRGVVGRTLAGLLVRSLDWEANQWHTD